MQSGVLPVNICMNEELKCRFCEKICKSQNSLRNHERLCKQNPNHQVSGFTKWNQKCIDLGISRPSWNKGKTAETDERIKAAAQKVKDGYETGRLIPSWKGKVHTDQEKKKISQSMKKAHAEGRAHNIGSCRWNNEPSWPEKWFMMVIENEFTDKQYQREFPFHRFALDFAWVHKKKCIEIDGEQHQRFEEVKKRDMEKDSLLEKDGWQVLRMPWKEVYKDTKTWIQKAKDFIHS